MRELLLWEIAYVRKDTNELRTFLMACEQTVVNPIESVTLAALLFLEPTGDTLLGVRPHDTQPGIVVVEEELPFSEPPF